VISARLTERSRESIPATRGSILEGAKVGERRRSNEAYHALNLFVGEDLVDSPGLAEHGAERQREAERHCPDVALPT